MKMIKGFFILHEVRSDGIVLAMPRRRITGVVGESEDLKVNHTDQPLKPDYETVQFFRPFFNPFFFIPFFLLFGLRRRF
jgi:hypothetical protein